METGGSQAGHGYTWNTSAGKWRQADLRLGMAVPGTPVPGSGDRHISGWARLYLEQQCWDVETGGSQAGRGCTWNSSAGKWRQADRRSWLVSQISRKVSLGSRERMSLEKNLIIWRVMEEDTGILFWPLHMYSWLCTPSYTCDHTSHMYTHTCAHTCTHTCN